MERPRHHLAPLLVVLLLGLVGGVAAATGADAQAACEPTNLATQIALFCAPDMPTAPCCEPVVASVDLGGGVPCLCRVAAQPQLVLARLNASHLLALYTACGGLRTGGAHLAAACQGPSPPAILLVAPPPPVAPRHKLPSRDALPPPATAQLSPLPQQQPGGASHGMTVPTQPAANPSPQVPAAAAMLLRSLVGGSAVTTRADTQTACEPTNLATQIALFCAPDMPTAPCCEAVVASIDLGGGVACLCRVAAQPQLVLARLNASDLLALYTACGGLRTGGAHLAAPCQGSSPPVVARPFPFEARRKLPSEARAPATKRLCTPPKQKPCGVSQGKAVFTLPAFPASQSLVLAIARQGYLLSISGRQVLDGLGITLSLLLFVSPYPIIKDIYYNGVQEHGTEVFFATLVNCAMGVYYLLSVRPDTGLLFVNITGAFIELGCLIFYFIRAGWEKKKQFLYTLVAAVAIFVVIISFSFVLGAGFMCAACGSLMYASQLIVLRKVYETRNETRSADVIPLPLTFISLFNAICWTFDALVKSDLYLTVSNCVGIAVGLILLIIYASFTGYQPIVARVTENATWLLSELLSWLLLAFSWLLLAFSWLRGVIVSLLDRPNNQARTDQLL